MSKNVASAPGPRVMLWGLSLLGILLMAVAWAGLSLSDLLRAIFIPS